MYVYKSKRGDQADLKHRIKGICETRVRYGYRRVHVLLRRDGWVNAKRVYRLYKELGLQLRNKTPKRRVKAKLREDRTDASQINETWVMDFVHDQLATGRKIRVLTIVDTFSRFSPAVDPRFSYRGEDVVQTLEQVCRMVGYPKNIRVDQGSKFISRDLDLWAYQLRRGAHGGLHDGVRNNVRLHAGSRQGRHDDRKCRRSSNARLRGARSIRYGDFVSSRHAVQLDGFYRRRRRYDLNLGPGQGHRDVDADFGVLLHGVRAPS